MAHTNQKKAGAAILISDGTDFRAKQVTRVKEDHHITIKGLISNSWTRYSG